ncbi:DNA replication/repair protein RecF [Pseudanabaena biceps]|nr:DNA replication/repair protein RecF [Pseudanabaena biceps]NUN63189.1 DNA replication/repair protein RecF [Pseudanabaena biceps]NUN67708.1 DNA replication/repair protein RecF [Pseudanabaena biceps]NUN67727.1 DNA replication/repair protein RecF [Pseudanabaena biceps]NUN67892.1 DNA replication/repair protein RecF [Pseudanabaena biceps]
MYLQSLHIKQFRNYIDQEVAFTAPKTVIVGNNAQGKSNLLEAVLLLATLRSHRVSKDRDLVRNGESVGEIRAICQRSRSVESYPVELLMRMRVSGKRTLNVNGVNQAKHLDFLGNLNTVMFSSLDLDLVRGSPESRRNWLDTVLIQLEPIYINLLQQYNQVLRQRNALLKSIKQGVIQYEPQQMALWDAQLVTAGTRLIRRRSRLLERLIPIARNWHQAISGGGEYLEITYVPKFAFTSMQAVEVVQQNFFEAILQKTIIEQHQGTSLVGPHRDEVLLTINDTPAREYGSQGQQRTLVLALKLAELELLESVIGEPPILLLDDVLAELDLQRQDHLLNAIGDRVQTIITTTHLGSFDAQWLDSARIFQVEKGEIVS